LVPLLSLNLNAVSVVKALKLETLMPFSHSQHSQPYHAVILKVLVLLGRYFLREPALPYPA
jgi:hypothetical protein